MANAVDIVYEKYKYEYTGQAGQIVYSFCTSWPLSPISSLAFASFVRADLPSRPEIVRENTTAYGYGCVLQWRTIGIQITNYVRAISN